MSRYQGDLKINISKDGADIIYNGGQPELDRGIVNSVLISLFTRGPWIGNVLFDNANKKIGGLFEIETRKPITSQTPNNVRFAAEYDLRWMRDQNGLNAKITVDVKNPTGDTLKVTILIEAPRIGRIFLELNRYSENWIATAEAA